MNRVFQICSNGGRPELGEVWRVDSDAPPVAQQRESGDSKHFVSNHTTSKSAIISSQIIQPHRTNTNLTEFEIDSEPLYVYLNNSKELHAEDRQQFLKSM